MSEFKHLNLYERQRIERYRKEKRSRRFIAGKLDRIVSSISDEINGNSVWGRYSAKKAHFKAYQKRWGSKIQCMKVAMDPLLKKFVIDSMTNENQSPEGISGRLKDTCILKRYTERVAKSVVLPSQSMDASQSTKDLKECLNARNSVTTRETSLSREKMAKGRFWFWLNERPGIHSFAT